MSATQPTVQDLSQYALLAQEAYAYSGYMDSI